MPEDFDFNVTALFGCIVGATAGFHAGGIVTAIDGAFIGFVASALCAAVIAELSYALWNVTSFGSRFLDILSPFITLGVLLILAQHYWA
jgi:hypothetical protein